MNYKKSNLLTAALICGLVTSLLGCAPADGGATSESSSAASAAPVQQLNLSAPSGQYVVDPAHATLQFSILHMGLSNYVAGFTSYSVDLNLNSTDAGASSVMVKIDPTSVRTDYKGDYKATHADSPFATWEEDLAMSDKFFNAAEYPEIGFSSTRVTEPTPGRLKVEGDLTLLGQTKPVTLTGTVVGSTAEHPFTKRGALGFSLSGSFERSAFGMNFLLSPPMLGDEVTVSFEGEMHLAQ